MTVDSLYSDGKLGEAVEETATPYPANRNGRLRRLGCQQGREPKKLQVIRSLQPTLPNSEPRSSRTSTDQTKQFSPSTSALKQHGSSSRHKAGQVPTTNAQNSPHTNLNKEQHKKRKLAINMNPT